MKINGGTASGCIHIMSTFSLRAYLLDHLLLTLLTLFAWSLIACYYDLICLITYCIFTSTLFAWSLIAYPYDLICLIIYCIPFPPYLPDHLLHTLSTEFAWSLIAYPFDLICLITSTMHNCMTDNVASKDLISLSNICKQITTRSNMCKTKTKKHY